MLSLDDLLTGSGELRAALEQASRSVEVVDAIEAWIDAVASGYVGGLSVPEARVALHQFDALRQMLQAIRSASGDLDRPAPAPAVPSEERPRPSKAKQIGSSIRDLIGGRPDRLDIGSADSPPAKARGDVGEVVAALRRAVGSFDRAVRDTYTPPPPPPVAELGRETHGELLEFLQDLIGDVQDGTTALIVRRVRHLPQLLESYGIRTESYQAGGQPSGLDTRLLFTFEPSDDPTRQDYTTMVPAFIKDGKVLLRGRVIEPAGTSR